MPNKTRHLAAILFADIVGYTALMGADEDRAFQAINHFKSVAQPLVKGYNGQWHKDLGDGALCSFGSALEAVQSAIEIQQRLNKEADYKVRIGIHLGDVTFQDGDVFGDGVNIASRIQGEAAEGGICVSEGVYNTIKNQEGIEVEYVGKRKMKNVRKAMGLYQIKKMGLLTKTGSRKRQFSLVEVGIIIIAIAAITGFLSRILYPSSEEKQMLPQRFQILLPPEKPLTPSGGTVPVSVLTISPDGNLLAYIAEVDSERTLALRRMNEFDITLVPGTEGAFFPFFSPDGKWIAFFSNGYLKKVLADGISKPVSLCKVTNPYSGDWSEDGKIIFVNNDGRELILLPDSGKSNPRELNISEDKHANFMWISFMPSGAEALFSDFLGNIYLLELNNGSLDLILEKVGHQPTYLTEGYLLVSQPGRLLAAPFSKQKKEIQNDIVPVLEGIRTESYRHAAQYSISNKGTLVYVPGISAANGNLVWVDHKGRMVDQLNLPSNNYGEFELSSDGAMLAYTKTVNEENEIWIFNQETGQNTLITTEGNGLFPKWNPDWHQIIFMSDRNGFSNLYKKEISGGKAIAITNNKTAQEPYDWSKSGQFLAHATEFGRDIFIRDLTKDETGVIKLTESPFMEWGARFSPKDEYIVYTSNEMGIWEIFVQPFPPTGERWQISSGGGAEPIWSPNGDFIYYKGQKFTELMAVQIKTDSGFSFGTPQLLFDEDFLDVPGRSHDISPDGKLFLMKRGVDRRKHFHEIHVVTNWFEELKRLAPPPD